VPDRFTERGLPPGPTSAPAAQTLQWIARPYDYVRECSAEFGDVFTLDFGSQGTYVVFSHPDALRAIFAAPSDVLHVGPGNAVLEPLVGSKSLLLLEERQHTRERRLLLPSFQPKTIARYGTVIREGAHARTADWTPGLEFDAQTVLQDISIDVIVAVLFGLRTPSAAATLKGELVELLNDRRLTMGLLGRLRDETPDPVLRSFQDRLKRLRQITRQIVETRRATAAVGSDDDVLSVLLSATDEQGQARSDEEIRDELLTLVVTGYETTATALAWGLHWVTAHDSVARRLRAEMETSGGSSEPQAIARLEYLDATCKEILRICPIVPSIFRQVAQPFCVAGYSFDVGIVLSPNIHLTHNREDLYPDSARFDPDRFLRRTYTPYEYLPFGGGARRCIGMHLAMYEMKLILASLLERFEFERAPGHEVVPVRRMVAVAPSGGPRLRVRHVRAS